jgi:hypothetical protein
VVLGVSSAALDRERVAAMAAAYRASMLPAASAEGVLDAALCSSVAGGVDPLAEVWLAHHGRYQHGEPQLPDAVRSSLSRLVQEISGVRLVMARHRVLRLRHLGYSLQRHDAAWLDGATPGRSARAPYPVELTLDLSERACGEAEIVYTHRGRGFFTTPQRPGVISVVERSVTVGRFDRYLTHRVGDAVVTRLIVLFTPADSG